MAIARPKEIVDKSNRLYSLTEGPVTFPLVEPTVTCIQGILKLVHQIPVQLLPRGPDGPLSNDAQAVMPEVTTLKRTIF